MVSNVTKEKFNSFELDEFYASLSAAKFLNIQKIAQRILVLFGSTYVFEQIFSVNRTPTNQPPDPSREMNVSDLF